MLDVPSPAEAGLITTPKIRCQHSAQVDPRLLIPHPGNPNKHPPKQIELFIQIICYSGWRRPITVSKRSNFVTKGHGALQAALAAGFKVVPVDFQDYDDENQELSDIIADNQLQRMSEIDNTMLTQLLVQLDNGLSDLQMTGIENAKLEQIFTSVPGYNSSSSKSELSLDGYEEEPTSQYAQESEHSGGPAEGQPYDQTIDNPSAVNTSHVRTIQLYFDPETVSEFMTIVEYFQGLLNIDNVTDTVLTVMRTARKGSMQ